MPRTILEIAQEAAERDNTAPAPVTLFGTNNRVAKALRIAAHDIIRDYLRTPDWQGQSEFTSTWAFAVQPGRYAYPLPPDFLRMIQNTEQRGGWPMGLVGPATPVTWARWLSGAAAVTAPMGWRIRNNLLLIEPTPAVAELVTIEYVSRYPVVSNVKSTDYDWTAKPPKAKSPYVPRDGHLDLPGYDVFAQLDDVFQFDGGDGWDAAKWGEEVSEKLKALNPGSAIAPLPQVRRPFFTADEDLPAFEDDHLLSLGMTFMLRRSLGKPYVEHAAAYEAEMEAKQNADGSSGRDLYIGRGREPVGTIPLGGGKWLVS